MDDTEQYLIRLLQMHHEQYLKTIEPIVRQLTTIRELRLPPPFVVNIDDLPEELKSHVSHN